MFHQPVIKLKNKKRKRSTGAIERTPKVHRIRGTIIERRLSIRSSYFMAVVRDGMIKIIMQTFRLIYFLKKLLYVRGICALRARVCVWQ